VTLHVEHLESLQFVLTVRQPGDGLADIGKIGPLVADAVAARIADGGDRAAGLHQPLREPVVGGVGAEEIAAAHDQGGRAGLRRLAQQLLHPYPNGALAGYRVLGRRLGRIVERVGSEIVDGARQHDARAVFRRRGDGIFEHRQYQLVPVAVARRVDRMHDQCAALGRRRDARLVHRVAGNPDRRSAVASPFCCGAGRVARHGSHGPAVPQQRACSLAADAAGRAKHQRGPLLRNSHASLLRCVVQRRMGSRQLEWNWQG